MKKNLSNTEENFYGNYHRTRMQKKMVLQLFTLSPQKDPLPKPKEHHKM